MPTKLENLLTPGGRLVMGSLTEKGDKDHTGAIIPEADRRYFFGVAIPKTAPGVTELIGQIYQMAATDYQSVPLVMQQIQQGLAARDFAWKIDDGDAPTYDKKTGQLRSTPDYMKGCYIFKFNTNFEIGACDAEGRDINRADIKRGDYVDVIFGSVINGKNDHTAGIYLNPNAIRRLGFGEAIQSGQPASAAFAGRAAVIPQGATQMPTASAPMPAAMGMPAAAPVPAPAANPSVPAGMPMGHVAMPAAAPVPAGVPMPTASPSSYPQILTGGMPGM